MSDTSDGNRDLAFVQSLNALRRAVQLNTFEMFI